MNFVYYAKSKNEDGYQPTVEEHLRKVSELAAEYGKEIGLEEQTRQVALLHDFGKYGDEFQGVLEGTNHNCDHAMCGAAWLYYNLRKRGRTGSKYASIFEAIMGHHDGLQNFYCCNDDLLANVEGKEVSINKGKIPALCGKDQYNAAWKEFKKSFSVRSKNIISFQPTMDGTFTPQLEEMLYTRMIFSCLVDADYSISASDNNKNYLKESECTAFQPELLCERLYCYMKRLRQHSDADNALNRMRDQVFEQCGRMGKQSPGLFTLTAPTGLGKTLAMLHFALQHCITNNKKRIIVVLPFLTIAEQNTRIYSEIVQNILVDHSQSELTDEEREFAERWRFPFIITTSVRFFETLFSHRPGDCRKLHHIANSVVLFDEVQSLPIQLTECTLHAVKELCERYHTTMVFSSATQPEFGALPEMQKLGWQPVEILPEHNLFYQQLQRTQVEWSVGYQTEWCELAQEIAAEDSVCAIVNLRKHARRLYRELKERCDAEELFFLTTDLCPAHRSEMIKRIQRRLADKQPCRVVSTQCIEAGVDLDFDRLYRSLAPLDAITQAAGRCNRNGNLAGKGTVVIFEPEQDEGIPYPSTWYGNAATVVREISARHLINIHDPEHIREYYRCIFEKDTDKKAIREAIKNRDYAEVDKEYKMIEDYGYPIIVPYGENYPAIRDEIKANGITPKLIRDAASITVTTTITKGNDIDDFAELFPLKKRKGGSGDKGYYLLRPEYEALYTPDMGLQLPEELTWNAIW